MTTKLEALGNVQVSEMDGKELKVILEELTCTSTYAVGSAKDDTRVKETITESVGNLPMVSVVMLLVKGFQRQINDDIGQVPAMESLDDALKYKRDRAQAIYKALLDGTYVKTRAVAGPSRDTVEVVMDRLAKVDLRKWFKAKGKDYTEGFVNAKADRQRAMLDKWMESAERDYRKAAQTELDAIKAAAESTDVDDAMDEFDI